MQYDKLLYDGRYPGYRIWKLLTEGSPPDLINEFLLHFVVIQGDELAAE
jgi:hypothetical protein